MRLAGRPALRETATRENLADHRRSRQIVERGAQECEMAGRADGPPAQFAHLRKPGISLLASFSEGSCREAASCNGEAHGLEPRSGFSPM